MNKFKTAADFVKAADAIPMTTSRPPPIDDARLTINITRSHHKRMKMFCVMNDITVGEMIEKWIDEKIPKP